MSDRVKIYSDGDIDYRSKRIIIADLDGTIAPSKSQMDGEMAALIAELLDYKAFALISGGKYEQFRKQFIGALNISPGHMERLYLFPTCATTLYRFQDGEWKQIYAEKLDEKEKRKIMDSFESALRSSGFERPERLYGDMLEDRDTQVTFSALGQQAPLELKSVWDPDQAKRKRIKAELDKLIPEFEVRIGGATSIDVTRKGIDKAYGIRKIESYLHYGLSEMLFIGDAIFEGGNDYPAKEAGVECIQVEGPEETKAVIREIIKASR